MIKTEGRGPGEHGLGTKAAGPGDHHRGDEDERRSPGDRAKDESPVSRRATTHTLTQRPIVSILCPSRGRPGAFAEFQATLTDNIEDVELLVALDADDATAWRYRFERFARPFTVERDWITRRVNQLANQATGDFLMWGNDDMRFTGPEWVEVLRAIDPTKPGVIGFPSGVHTTQHFPFPILTRRAYELQGFYVPECLRGVYADTWLYDVGRRAGCLYYCPSYRIEHLHWSTNDREIDAIDRDKSMRGTGADVATYNRMENERQTIAALFRANR